MGAYEALAAALAVYLDCGEGEDPQERSDRLNALGEPVSRILQDLMADQPGWDARYTWLDGMVVQVVRRISPDVLSLAGGVFVVNGQRAALRPVAAELSRAPAASLLHFASADAEVAYVRGREDRLDIPADPATWPYQFEVALP